MINKIIELEAHGCLFRVKVKSVKASGVGFALTGSYIALVDKNGEILTNPYVYAEGVFFSDDIKSWTLTDRTTLLDKPEPSVKIFMRFLYKGEKDTTYRPREIQVLHASLDGSYLEGIDQGAGGGFKRFLTARIDGGIQTVLDVA